MDKSRYSVEELCTGLKIKKKVNFKFPEVFSWCRESIFCWTVMLAFDLGEWYEAIALWGENL